MSAKSVETLRMVEEALANIVFTHHPTISVRYGIDTTGTLSQPELTYWLQLVDSALPKEYSTGRKWRLSQHMTESEVVGTAFAAYKAWLEHEMMESFTYKGVAVFNPHVSMEARVRMAADPANYEYRS